MDDMDAGPGGPGNSISGQIVEVVSFAACECCGLIEECTLSYIEAIRERYGGKWICGLCAEAVKDEVFRCRQIPISPDEAMARHWSFCNKVRASSPPEDPTVHLIRALRKVVRKSLESPKFVRSLPSAPSNSCIPNLALVEGGCK